MSSIEKADLDNLKNFFSNRNKEIKKEEGKLLHFDLTGNEKKQRNSLIILSK